MKKQAFFQHITLSQEKVLTALATFKFLSTGQLLQLQVMSDRANLNKHLAQLRTLRKPLIFSITFGVHPSMGKLDSVHGITVHGAHLLKDRYGENYPVRFPKGSSGLFQQDYFHRINTVSIHMAFMGWAAANDATVISFRTYFDKLSSGKEKGFRAESAIYIHENDYLIADALCLLQTKRREELYAIEMYNGDDTNRVHGSLFAHLKALKEGQPSKQFGLTHGSRVLCVFEKENYKVQAMKRIAEDERFISSKAHFLFKSIEELSERDFFEWRLFDGTKAGLF